MKPDIFCRLTKTDGSTTTLWLPAKQVEVMRDLDSREGRAINAALDVVSIDVVQTDEEPPKPRPSYINREL